LHRMKLTHSLRWRIQLWHACFSWSARGARSRRLPLSANEPVASRGCGIAGTRRAAHGIASDSGAQEDTVKADAARTAGTTLARPGPPDDRPPGSPKLPTLGRTRGPF
jgi:hypothetical protein